MSSPRRLPTFEYNGKLWTVDSRLREFRFVVLGEIPEFVSFDSPAGFELLEALEALSGTWAD
jgi:hypothetical protein